MVRNSLVVLAIVMIASCGASARDKTIRATFVATSSARDAFHAWDVSHQHDLVDGATSRDDALARIQAYRETQVRVIAAFETVFRAVGTAAILSDDSKSLASLLSAFAEAKSAVELAEHVMPASHPPPTTPVPASPHPGDVKPATIVSPSGGAK